MSELTCGTCVRDDAITLTANQGPTSMRSSGRGLVSIIKAQLVQVSGCLFAGLFDGKIQSVFVGQHTVFNYIINCHCLNISAVSTGGCLLSQKMDIIMWNMMKFLRTNLKENSTHFLQHFTMSLISFGDLVDIIIKKFPLLCNS